MQKKTGVKTVMMLREMRQEVQKKDSEIRNKLSNKHNKLLKEMLLHRERLK